MNMKEQVECIRRHVHMEAGFVANVSEYGWKQPIWSPAEPKESFLIGLKLAKEQVVPVTTFRCPKYGYLESYAIR
jgi:hypothetical protein